jgi:hypothetical protein
MGNYNTTCCRYYNCFDSCCSCCFRPAEPTTPMFEIHAHPCDLLTLHDGLASIFVKGAFEEVVFNCAVTLVIAGRRCAVLAAWVPPSPRPFADYLGRVTMVSAVLRLVEDECDVMVVHDSVDIVPLKIPIKGASESTHKPLEENGSRVCAVQ